jgi:2-phosphosulfolactate phosphatase
VLIDVAPTAEALNPSQLRASTVLVVDVLRASTTMIAALANGCAAIVPVADAEEARRRARSLPGASVLVAGERRGQAIPGFHLGNSPLEFTPDRVRDTIVVFTTSNGTRALLAARGAPAVGVGALVNLSAAAAWARAGRRDVTVLCAGQRGAVSLEDHVCAGLLVERLLREEPGASATATAVEALRVGRQYGHDLAQLAEASPWARHLARVGRAADVAACLMLDTATLVPVYRADVDKVVPGPRYSCGVVAT